jgi:hypothetical protein
MNATLADIIRHCWSVEPKDRYPFDGIFAKLHGIGFKITAGVDSPRVMALASSVCPKASRDIHSHIEREVRFKRARFLGLETVAINRLDGIVAQLTKICGGDVRAHGIVDMTSSDPLASDGNSSRVMMLNWELIRILRRLFAITGRRLSQKRTIGFAMVSWRESS